MNNMKFVVKLSVVATLGILSLNIGGCASNCSTNPGEMTRLCGASYQLGMNKKLEQHLVDRQAEADQLVVDASQMRERLAQSDSLLASTELKLRAVVAKTEGAREDARRLAGELALKRMDIETKQAELGVLEERLSVLRDAKSEKKEHTLELATARNEITQTKQEVETLVQYIESDLLIRAENALAYD